MKLGVQALCSFQCRYYAATSAAAVFAARRDKASNKRQVIRCDNVQSEK